MKEGTLYVRDKDQKLILVQEYTMYVDVRFSGWWNGRFVKKDGTLGKSTGGYAGGYTEYTKKYKVVNKVIL